MVPNINLFKHQKKQLVYERKLQINIRNGTIIKTPQSSISGRKQKILLHIAYKSQKLITEFISWT